MRAVAPSVIGIIPMGSIIVIAVAIAVATKRTSMMRRQGIVYRAQTSTLRREFGKSRSKHRRFAADGATPFAPRRLRLYRRRLGRRVDDARKLPSLRDGDVPRAQRRRSRRLRFTNGRAREDARTAVSLRARGQQPAVLSARRVRRGGGGR